METRASSFELSPDGRRADVPVAAFGAVPAHPHVIEVVHVRFGEKRDLEVPFHRTFGADSCSGEVGASRERDLSVHDENLGVHTNTVKELHPRAQGPFGVNSFIPVPKRPGREFRVDDSKGHPPVHECGHEIDERDKIALKSETCTLYVGSGDPHETPGLYELRFGELLVNLSIPK